LATVLRLVDGDAAMAGGRALDKEAAVGLLSRSMELLLKVDFLVGVGTGSGALRDRARDAAVGAKSPVDGVFDRLEVGVLAREASERGPVLD
jgi:hypothetical protein